VEPVRGQPPPAAGAEEAEGGSREARGLGTDEKVGAELWEPQVEGLPAVVEEAEELPGTEPEKEAVVLAHTVTLLLLQKLPVPLPVPEGVSFGLLLGHSLVERLAQEDAEGLGRREELIQAEELPEKETVPLSLPVTELEPDTEVLRQRVTVWLEEAECVVLVLRLALGQSVNDGLEEAQEVTETELEELLAALSES